MSGEFIAFFLLSLFIFAGAIFMISLTRVVHMVFAISFTFLSIAALYVLLQAEFVAVAQVIIYTGAISILAVFGIMLTRHQDHEETKKRRSGHKAFVFLAVVAFLGILVWGINSTPWGDQVAQFEFDNTKEIGKSLFTNYVIPFELASVLLLLSLVGAIVMAKEEGEKE